MTDRLTDEFDYAADPVNKERLYNELMKLMGTNRGDMWGETIEKQNLMNPPQEYNLEFDDPDAMGLAKTLANIPGQRSDGKPLSMTPGAIRSREKKQKQREEIEKLKRDLEEMERTLEQERDK
jgi:hypothetical protein